MMLDMNTIRELLPAYAIGALEPEERRQIEAVLAQHPDLRAELDAWQGVSDALLSAVPQMQPPAALRDAIMERASGGRAIRPLPARRQLVYGLVAAVVLIIAGVLLVFTRSDEPQVDTHITSIMDDSASTWYSFEGTEDFKTVSGAVVIAPDHQQAVLWVQNLDVLNEAQAYQFWLARGEDQRISGLVFQPEESETWQLVDLPADFAEYIGFGVTIEPAGGSEEPTSSPVFVGAFE